MTGSFEIRLRYLGILAAVTAKAEEALLVEAGATPLTVAEALGRKYGEDVRRLIFDRDGGLRVGVAVDGHLVPPAHELHPGDVIAFISAVAGGS